MGFFDRLLGRPEEVDPTQGNWYDPMPQQQPGYNSSPNRLINGGLRDILGALADAHAESQDMDANYGPKRMNERTSEAMGNFAEDPMAAIQRMSKVDPKAAYNMFGDYQKAQAAAAKAKLEGVEASDKHGKAGDERDEISRKQIAAMVGSGNEETWPRLKQQISVYAKTRGYNIDPADLPDTFNSNLKDVWTRRAVDPKAIMAEENDRAYRDARLADFDEDRNLRERDYQTDREYKRGQLIQQGMRTDAIQSAEPGRNSRFEAAEEGRNYRNDVNEGGRSTRANQAEAGRNARSGTETQPPRSGKYKGETATSPTGAKYIWDGTKWNK